MTKLSNAQLLSNQFTTLGSKDGLDIEYITSITNDSSNLIWISGYNRTGIPRYEKLKKAVIQRYNGLSFFTYQFPFEGHVESMMYLEDSGDFLCHLKNHALNAYKLIKFNPYNYSIKEIDVGLNHEEKTLISELVPYDNKLLLLTKHGDSIFLVTLDKQLNLTHKIFLSSDPEGTLARYNTLIPFQDHFIWNEPGLGVQSIDWDGNLIKKHENYNFGFADKIDVGVVYIDQKYIDHSQTILGIRGTLTDYKYFTYDSIDKQFNSVPDGDNFIKYAPHPQTSNVTESINSFNLVLINGIDSGAIQIYKEDRLLHDISSPTFKSLSDVFLKSDESSVWVADYNKLYTINLLPFGAKATMIGKSLRAIHPIDKNYVIASTQNSGWYKVNINSGEFRPITLRYNQKLFLPKSLSSGILQDSNTIWGTYSEGLFKIDKNSNNVDIFRHYPVNCLIDHGSTILYGTTDYALMEFNKRTGQQTQLIETKDHTIHDIIHMSDTTNILMATNRGLQQFNLEDKQLIKYKLPNAPVSDFPMCLARLNKSTILIGTHAGRMHMFDETSGELTEYYIDPLESIIASILIDSEQIIWINTFQGIVKFDMSKGVIKRYSTQDGLAHNECNRYSKMKMPNGKILVGGLNGLSIITPTDKLTTNPLKPILVSTQYYEAELDSLVKINSPVALLNLNNEITLPPTNRFLSFEFGLTKYVENDDYKFEYKLNQSDEWRLIGDRNKLQFPSLSPGDYSLQVRIVNSLGTSISSTLLYEIKVEDFFYRQWWFILLFVLSLFLIASYLIYDARKQQRIQKLFSQQLIDNREFQLKKISREIHDSAGQNLILLKLKAKNAGYNDIQHLAENTLNEIREISHNLHPFVLEKLGLTAAIQRLIQMMDDETEIFVSNRIDTVDGKFSKSTELHIYRIVQECLNNLIKHSKAESAKIELYLDDSNLQIMIKDNGVGFKKVDGASNRLGLRTINERLDIINGKIDIKSKQGSGTLVDMVIPFDR